MMLKRSAFTLIELMVVVVIIGLLLSLLSGAILRSRDNARSTKADSDRRSLTSAMWAYRHEYGLWPCGSAVSGTNNAFSDDNYKVWAAMDAENEEDNYRGIQFLTLGEYLTNTVRSIINPVSGEPYEVIFNLENDTVTVN